MLDRSYLVDKRKMADTLWCKQINRIAEFLILRCRLLWWYLHLNYRLDINAVSLETNQWVTHRNILFGVVPQSCAAPNAQLFEYVRHVFGAGLPGPGQAHTGS